MGIGRIFVTLVGAVAGAAVTGGAAMRGLAPLPLATVGGAAAALAVVYLLGDRRYAIVAPVVSYIGVGTAIFRGLVDAAVLLGASFLIVGGVVLFAFGLRLRAGNRRRLSTLPVDPGRTRRMIASLAQWFDRVASTVERVAAAGIGPLRVGTLLLTVAWVGVVLGLTVEAMQLGPAATVGPMTGLIAALVAPFYAATDWKALDGLDEPNRNGTIARLTAIPGGFLGRETAGTGSATTSKRQQATADTATDRSTDEDPSAIAAGEPSADRAGGSSGDTQRQDPDRGSGTQATKAEARSRQEARSPEESRNGRDGDESAGSDGTTGEEKPATDDTDRSDGVPEEPEDVPEMDDVPWENVVGEGQAEDDDDEFGLGQFADESRSLDPSDDESGERRPPEEAENVDVGGEAGDDDTEDEETPALPSAAEGQDEDEPRIYDGTQTPEATGDDEPRSLAPEDAGDRAEECQEAADERTDGESTDAGSDEGDTPESVDTDDERIESTIGLSDRIVDILSEDDEDEDEAEE